MDRLVDEALAKVNESIDHMSKYPHVSEHSRKNQIARAIHACQALISALKTLT